MNWEDFISEKQLLRQLCRWRARLAQKRHPVQRLMALTKDGYCESILPRNKSIQSLLPSRRQWIRIGYHNRQSIPESKLLETTIFRSALKTMKARGEPPEWLKLFQVLATKIKQCATLDTITLTPPTLHLIPKGNGEAFRCLASFDAPFERLLLSQAAKYLRNIFDPLMSNCSFAFRKENTRNYKMAIEKLIEYRKVHEDNVLYVAECDIQSFFDVINHDIVGQAYDAFVQQLDEAKRPEPILRKILTAYLDCFTSRGNLNASTDEKIKCLRNRVKSLETTGVGECYPSQDLAEIPLGIPQGGALSPLIANIVLDSADRAVCSTNDPELLYLRFCDDIIIVHPNKQKCKAALDRYVEALTMMKLPIHPLEKRVTHGAEYFKKKSKGPFVWANPGTRKTAIPWVAFLGVHVRYDGVVRVRKESIEKHKQTLAKELRRYKDAVGKNGEKLRDGSEMARKVLFHSFEAHLVSIGVGYSSIQSPNIGQNCWVAAFPSVTRDPPGLRQFKSLDQTRGALVSSLRKMLGFKPGEPLPSNSRGFYGRPYSYYGTLLDIERRTSYPPVPTAYSEWE